MIRLVTDLATLDSLDDAEVLDGYHDGLRNEPKPGDNRSLSYCHGWRNGLVDGGHAKPSAEQMALVRLVVSRPCGLLGTRNAKWGSLPCQD